MSEMHKINCRFLVFSTILKKVEEFARNHLTVGAGRCYTIGTKHLLEFKTFVEFLERMQWRKKSTGSTGPITSTG